MSRIYNPQFVCDVTDREEAPGIHDEDDLLDDRPQAPAELQVEALPESWTECRWTTKRPNPQYKIEMDAYNTAMMQHRIEVQQAAEASILEAAARRLGVTMEDPQAQQLASEQLQDTEMMDQVRDQVERQLTPPEEPQEPRWILSEVVLHYSPAGVFKALRGIPDVTDAELRDLASRLHLPEPKGGNLPSAWATERRGLEVPDEDEELPDIHIGGLDDAEPTPEAEE